MQSRAGVYFKQTFLVSLFFFLSAVFLVILFAPCRKQAHHWHTFFLSLFPIRFLCCFQQNARIHTSPFIFITVFIFVFRYWISLRCAVSHFRASVSPLLLKSTLRFERPKTYIAVQKGPLDILAEGPSTERSFAHASRFFGYMFLFVFLSTYVVHIFLPVVSLRIKLTITLYAQDAARTLT